MKKSILLSAALCLFSLSASAQFPDYQADKPTEIKLFNGENLDNWYTYIRDRGKNVDPKGVFTVKDGLLHISGEEWGCITTEKEYDNYIITMKYKWGEKTHSVREGMAMDSGFLFHSIGEDGASSTAWMTSIEANIYQGRTGEFIVIGEKDKNFRLSTNVAPGATTPWNGRFQYDGEPLHLAGNGMVLWRDFDPEWKNEAGFRGKNDVEKPYGEWNTMECIIIGDEAYIMLNGELVNYGYNISPSKGKIQIQSEGAEIIFSEITMKLL